MAAETRTQSRVSLKPSAEDHFRGLWASLFYSGRAGKSVMLCCADRREGTSTVAAGLAVAGSLPNGTSRVALVDMNIRTPALHKLLGCSDSPGVAEAIAGDASPESAAQPLSEGLDFYPVGNVGSRALEVLRSDRVGQFLDALRERYDHIIVDVAAANQYPDAEVLAAVIRDVVMVAHTEQTPREALAQAKKRVEAAGGGVVGLVLNQRTYPIPRFLYRRV